ncbi:hypothetical protein MHLP_03830 [Candidatus Mycoplasma haematolamae str. Purdue]|uniref:Uncharacterized protein n=1 Tax=Mycoplasma haematolamae (strain Purdue) TaxID=1212765 RepID=I7CGF2_MYCHA|nr:hypothetical protein [Candidatus Mycoplasma haematolamae]AFO52346.1 hypothetical protein MHLP_03830 [Candidatus Mycoplasma haematolamae str. Purdue]
MFSKTLWLKGLSQQGKIYLATSSLALGSATTGALAVDGTRDSIWQGVSYVSSSISNFLGMAFETSDAPPASSESSDETVNGVFKEAWEGLTLVITRGATWSWKSITYAGKWISEMKSTYNAAKTWSETAWSNLKEHWYTLWIFLRSSFTSINLEKIYQMLSNGSTRQLIIGDKSQLKTVADKMKSIMNKSGSIGFDVGGPFRKLLKTFTEDQSNLTKVISRLDILKSYVEGSTAPKKEAAQALVDFFSSIEDTITNLKFEGSSLYPKSQK